MSATARANPTILVVTPEIASVPHGMEPADGSLVAKAGGLADVTAGLVTALFELGADVHVAVPNYRHLFHIDARELASDALRRYKTQLPNGRIHLAEDSIFYYRASVYGSNAGDNPRSALRFQREVINHIVPRVNPDLIHCNDWMTGLIPAAARRLGIACLFTVHNIHTHEMPLAAVEDSGIDPRELWSWLYYERFPGSYDQALDGNRVDLLASGIFAAHFVNTVSPTFLQEILKGHHSFVPDHVRTELRHKADAACAAGVLNAPPAAFQPGTDALIRKRYSPLDHVSGKAANKRVFQQAMGLAVNPEAPLFLWPSRLDPSQKGCALLTDILYEVLAQYEPEGLQIAIVADGPFQCHFRDILHWHALHRRLAIHAFDETLSHLGYAGADFVLIPSRFEPCGLPQMIGAVYGALPVVRDTGGLHDTITHLDTSTDQGNGFVFETYDSNGLHWAMDQAMRFYARPEEVKQRTVTRIMIEAMERFNHRTTAKHYFALYETMLGRPLVSSGAD